MRPRGVLLRSKHLAHLAGDPILARLGDAQLEIFERFCGFCVAHGLARHDQPAFQAFASLDGIPATQLEALGDAIAALGADARTVAAIHAAIEALRHREGFCGIPKTVSRVYEREVSVPPEDLPADWRRTLSRLRMKRAFAASIIARMERRLCMFAWSARRAGLPVNLGEPAAQQAFHADIRGRSAERHDGAPRFAYLRSSWEELLRFAEAHGETAQTCADLRATYETQQRREAQQSPLKMTKIPALPQAPELLERAAKMLAAAAREGLAARRHAARNAAAAIALGVIVPARPADVHAHHRFGAGLFYEGGRYRFLYVPTKTRRAMPEPLDLPLDRRLAPFVDALIVHDHDPAWLAQLRADALAARRPLYVNYDGSPCAHSWYSRIWAREVGTGGHIARTLVYETMAADGEFGLRYAAAAAHHRTARASDRYRSAVAVSVDVALAQDALVARGFDDDISDLL